MMHSLSSPGGRYRAIRIVVLAIALLVGIGYPLVLALRGFELVNVSIGARGTSLSIHNARPWLIVAAVAALLALADWMRAERRLEELRRAGADAQRVADEASRRREEAEAARDRLRHQLDDERHQREQIVRAWRSEREWNTELREQILHMQRSRGVLGRHNDVREMILELTMDLVDAEKGILLSQRHEPDGELEMVCSLGFDEDPRHSALAQRFATEVIERDRTIREDDGHRLDAEKRTAADEEVRNLLAIPIYLLDDFSGVIVCVNREGGFDGLDDEVLLAVGNHAGVVLQNSRLHGDLRQAYLSTIAVLADAIELKDPELRGHSDAVSQYVLAVADRLDFEPHRREALIFASLLHDVGKLGISERILLKPAALTAEERSIMQLHPRIGYELVRRIPVLREVAPAVLHHHERFDGEGYPSRLRGETIPLEARIISVADTFSAITSDRPYSPARSPNEACAELERCAGEQFDPEVVRLFVEEVRRHPPDEQMDEPLTEVPELDAHRHDGDFKLGARSFGITDSLTMLYSRRHFQETANSEAQRSAVQGRPFAVLVLQLHDLAEINRERGYAAGDAVIQGTAAALQHAAGCHQGVACRVSGRRLGLIVAGMGEDEVVRLASELEQQLRPHPERDGTSGGPNIAIATGCWRAGESGEDVVERALGAISAPAAPSSR